MDQLEEDSCSEEEEEEDIYDQVYIEDESESECDATFNALGQYTGTLAPRVN